MTFPPILSLVTGIQKTTTLEVGRHHLSFIVLATQLENTHEQGKTIVAEIPVLIRLMCNTELRLVVK